jgi:uncharacterized protein (TIGR02996 family)
MTEREAFVRQVCERPEDDTPRLVFADWLTEHGEGDYGEFIRVQVEIARWPCECDTSEERVYHDECRCGELQTLRLRQRELYHLQGPDNLLVRGWAGPVLGGWGQDLQQPMSDAGRRAVWSRGFVGEVVCPADTWLKDGTAILAAHPVTTVTLSTPIHRITTGTSMNRIVMLTDEISGWQFEGIKGGLERQVRRLLQDRWPRVTTWNLPDTSG